MIAELTAVRSILLSMLFTIGKNGKFSEAMVYQFIEDADRDKLTVAYEQLAATSSSKPRRRTP